MVQGILKEIVIEGLKDLDIQTDQVYFEHPTDLKYGDFATNVAMVYGKELGEDPKELAEKIVQYIKLHKPEEIENVEVAGSGFINFYLNKEFFAKSIQKILGEGENWGENGSLKGEKIMVEYTDPNPFKEFHIGHLMSNAIGESISRLIEFSGAEVKRANYQGDVGPHVAKALWGRMENPNHLTWGASYSFGAKMYEEDEGAKKEIDNVNKELYKFCFGSSSNLKLQNLYKEGLDETQQKFEEIYKKLGMKARNEGNGRDYFDYYFLESMSGAIGKEIVKESSNVFEEGESKGVIIFRGEKYDKKLHTRVFINSEGLPTYEAKELGLLKSKLKFNFDTSITITGNEQEEYFKVVLKAAEQIEELAEFAKKTLHITHGMMRLSSGKMSSRTGDVITAMTLIGGVKTKIRAIINDRDVDNKDETAEHIAIGALKYWILKQTADKDIVFDEEKALSFEGASGPYLQYAHTRAHSILEKAGEKSDDTNLPDDWNTTELEKLLYRFPEIVERAQKEYEPHYVTTYLTELASAFGNFYANERILDADEKERGYKLALVESFKITMKNGLWLLGIKVPERM